jgi:hypothetical protein
MGQFKRYSRKGDWSCPCGQAYRVTAAAGEVRMWARNRHEGYAPEPIGDSCLCGAPIARGTVLAALFGATVRTLHDPDAA